MKICPTCRCPIMPFLGPDCPNAACPDSPHNYRNDGRQEQEREREREQTS